MIADPVPFAQDALDTLAMSGNKIANNKKRCLDIKQRQCFQHGFGLCLPRTVVKRQPNFLPFHLYLLWWLVTLQPLSPHATNTDSACACR
ncbi:hypothetical protein D3C85_1642290 [compost metagenome]